MEFSKKFYHLTNSERIKVILFSVFMVVILEAITAYNGFIPFSRLVVSTSVSLAIFLIIGLTRENTEVIITNITDVQEVLKRITENLDKKRFTPVQKNGNTILFDKKTRFERFFTYLLSGQIILQYNDNTVNIRSWDSIVNPVAMEMKRLARRNLLK